MKTRYLNKTIEFDETYRPNEIVVDGKPMSMTRHEERHDGKSWKFSPAGNILMYEAEDGTGIHIPQKLFMNDIKTIRATYGLSQKELSERFDIPKRTIENWESGVNTPPRYVIALIKEALSKRDDAT